MFESADDQLSRRMGVRPNSSRLVCYGIVISWTLWIFFRSLTIAIDIPTVHIDGAFQTASGLHRLDAGQFPGRDFFPYLGIGPLFVLFPLFEIGGATMAASVFAANCVTMLFSWAAIALIWHLIWRPQFAVVSFAISAVGLIVPQALFEFDSLPNCLKFAAEPGPSLRPLRSAAPYLIVWFYYCCIIRLPSQPLRFIAAGSAVGILLVWSNDYALSTACLFALWPLGDAYFNRTLRVGGVLLLVASATCTWFILLTTATHGNPIEMLRYNFQDVARDQWWMFGAYGEAARFFDPRDAPKLITGTNIRSFVVLLGATLVAAVTRRREHVLLVWIGVALFSGGVIASIGGHIGKYFFGFYCWAVATAGIGIMRLLWLAVQGRFALHTKALSWAALLALLGLSAGCAGAMWHEYRSTLTSARADSARFFIPELGGFLQTEWKSYIEKARTSTAKNEFEEYWGIWSATRRKNPAWKVDSAIHALGSKREQSKSLLHDADLIITTRNSNSPRWQPWCLSQDYWLYEDLLRGWDPDLLSPTTIVWKKRALPRAIESVQCKIGDDPVSVAVETPQPGYYEIKLEYQFQARGRQLLMARNYISYGSDEDGFASLDPHGTRAVFPLYARHAGTTLITFKVFGRSPAELRVTSCSASRITLEHDESLPMHDLVADDFFPTNAEWDHGISRIIPGFVVPKTRYFVNKYAVGSRIIIGNGETRTVTRTEMLLDAIIIQVEGDDLLQYARVGLPSRFQSTRGESTNP